MKLLVAIQSILIIILVWMLSIYGKDEFYNDKNTDNGMQTNSFVINGNQLIIPAETQKLIGLTVGNPSITTFKNKKKFPGIIMPITDLIDADRDSKILRLAIKEALLKTNQRKHDKNRIVNLFNSGKKASSRQVELAHLEFEKNKKILNELLAKEKAILLKITANWSEHFARLLSSDQNLMDTIINKKIQIARFATREKISLKDITWKIKSVNSGINESVKGEIIGPAGSTMVGEIGKTWLIKAKSLDLPSNSPVTILSESSTQQFGVEIPKESVVRYAGKLWVYLLVGHDKFERKKIAENLYSETGYFSKEVTTEDTIVIVGAQTLLSEELKHLITNENED